MLVSSIIIFTPNPWGFMIQIDEHIFQMGGEKPPGSWLDGKDQTNQAVKKQSIHHSRNHQVMVLLLYYNQADRSYWPCDSISSQPLTVEAEGISSLPEYPGGWHGSCWSLNMSWGHQFPWKKTCGIFCRGFFWRNQGAAGITHFTRLYSVGVGGLLRRDVGSLFDAREKKDPRC